MLFAFVEEHWRGKTWSNEEKVLRRHILENCWRASMSELLRKGCLLNVVEECYTSFAKEGPRDMREKFWDCGVQKGVIVHWAWRRQLQRNLYENSAKSLARNSACMLSRSCLPIKCQCDNSIQFYRILCNYPILFKCHMKSELGKVPKQILCHALLTLHVLLPRWKTCHSGWPCL